MAAFKVIIRSNNTDKDKKTPVYIQVTHKSKTRYINTGIKVLEDQFKDGQVINHNKAGEYNIKLRRLWSDYEEKVLNLGHQRVKTMEMKTLLHMLRNIKQNTGESDFFEFTQNHINNLVEENREGYAATFTRTKDHLESYAGTNILLFSEITPHFLADFERKLKLTGKNPTTIGIYMRNIRTLFNLAITDPNIKVSYNEYPFRQYKIPKPQTRKINLETGDIQKIINLKPNTWAETMAKDLFLLSFYCIGINFKDLILLKKTDMYRGRLIFDRAKTGKPYNIFVQPEALEIIEKHKGHKYLLSFYENKLRTNENPDRVTPLYKDITDQVNKTFRRIANDKKDKRIDFKVTTYFARHSWATIARNIGIPKDDIITALGHGTNTVTDAYIEIDYQRIDEANRRVIDSIK